MTVEQIRQNHELYATGNAIQTADQVSLERGLLLELVDELQKGRDWWATSCIDIQARQLIDTPEVDIREFIELHEKYNGLLEDVLMVVDRHRERVGGDS